MNKNLVGAEGITSASANYLCNLAKELKAKAEAELKNISLYDEAISLIGSATETPIKTGVRSLCSVRGLLERISNLNGFIAYFREAIKAKEAWKSEIENDSFKPEEVLDFTEWTEENHIVVPNTLDKLTWELVYNVKEPEAPELDEILTKEKLMDGMSIGQALKFFTIQASAAVIGEFIHPDGAFNKERQDYLKIISCPNRREGTGKDTCIFIAKPTVEAYEVEKLFTALQGLQREYQAQLNGMLAEIDNKISEDKREKLAQYKIASGNYQKEVGGINDRYIVYKDAIMQETLRYHNRYSAYRQEVESRNYVGSKEFEKLRATRLDNLKKLKIIVPDNLKDLYNDLNSTK